MAYGLKACSCHPLMVMMKIVMIIIVMMMFMVLMMNDCGDHGCNDYDHDEHGVDDVYDGDAHDVDDNNSKDCDDHGDDNYRLITAYLLLRVNLDKIMHARRDFDA